jgi:hypothetical protein
MLTPEQIDAIERDAGAGLSVSEIQHKHKIAYETAKRYAPNAAKSKKGKKRAGGGDLKHRAASNGHVTISATPELIETIWNSLSLERKAALLGKM